MIEKYEVYELDFSHVKGNEQVKAQGKTICIKTSSRGFFSLDLEKFPSRQDLAKKTFVVNFDMKHARQILKSRLSGTTPDYN